MYGNGLNPPVDWNEKEATMDIYTEIDKYFKVKKKDLSWYLLKFQKYVIFLPKKKKGIEKSI